MKEHPILFSPPMVRALLAGTKTQTRRVVKAVSTMVRHEGGIDVTAQEIARYTRCPYGVPGDRLWVRETWAPFHAGIVSDVPSSYCPVEEADAVRYAADGRICWSADGKVLDEGDGKPHRWHPSIHMPRWASRLVREVVAVRVERLQAISEHDAQWEGVGLRLADDMGPLKQAMTAACARSRVDGFRVLWESIHGAGSWDINPWLWVVEFKKV